MLDYLSGYKSFGYEELTEHQVRLEKASFHAVREQSFGKKILNRLGHSLVHFGQWLIRLTEIKSNNLNNSTDMCRHYGE